MISRDDVLNYFSALDEVEFIDILYGLIERRRDEDVCDQDWHIDTLVIGHCISTSKEPVAYTEILARPSKEVANFLEENREVGFFESGRCGLCNTIISSVERVAVCPICTSYVECT